MLYIYLLTCIVSVLSNHPLPISTFLSDILISDSFSQQQDILTGNPCAIYGLCYYAHSLNEGLKTATTPWESSMHR